MKTCKDCSYFKKKRCTRFSVVIKEFINVDDCKFYTTAALKPKNKKNPIKIKDINPKKEDICKFVSIEWIELAFVRGNFKAKGKRKGNGLLINNRIYLLNGKYKFADGKSLEFTKVYDGIPNWANQDLRQKYKEFKQTKNSKK